MGNMIKVSEAELEAVACQIDDDLAFMASKYCAGYRVDYLMRANESEGAEYPFSGDMLHADNR